LKVFHQLQEEFHKLKYLSILMKMVSSMLPLKTKEPQRKITSPLPITKEDFLKKKLKDLLKKLKNIKMKMMLLEKKLMPKIL